MSNLLGQMPFGGLLNYDITLNEVTVKFNGIKNDFDKAENWFKINSAEEQ